MKTHLHKEFKLWSFVVLCQSQSRMQKGKREESNMKFKRTATVGHISITFRSPFYGYYMSFRSLGSQESNASNVCKSELKRRSYGRLKTTASSCAKFCSPKPISQLRNPPLAHECHFAAHASIFAAANHVAKSPPSCKWSCKSSPSCEITFNLQNQSSNLENGQFNVQNPPVQSHIFATD